MRPPRVCRYRKCRKPFQPAATGRLPDYCSATCRKEAWYDDRAQAAVEAALLEHGAANRGNETANRGNESTPAAPVPPVPVGGEECPYCREPVQGLVANLLTCPDGPGLID